METWTIVMSLEIICYSSFSSPSSSQTEKFSGAVPHEDGSSPFSAEAEPGQEAEHENMTNLLISTDRLTVDHRGPRRSRAVRSKSTFPFHD